MYVLAHNLFVDLEMDAIFYSELVMVSKSTKIPKILVTDIQSAILDELEIYIF